MWYTVGMEKEDTFDTVDRCKMCGTVMTAHRSMEGYEYCEDCEEEIIQRQLEELMEDE